MENNANPKIPPKSKRGLQVAVPTVIDDTLLRNSICAPNYVPLSAEKLEEMKTESEFHQVEALSLSFQNILQIQNFNGFDSLVKLQLDNNIIQKIEHIGHLTNLTWLDLSFNEIDKIEGLDPLTKLTDLSLYSNSITELKVGLDTLVNLNMLSVGQNLLKSMDEVMNLRQFRNLKMLTLAGNEKLDKDQDYPNYVIAHLSFNDWQQGGHLSFLDYKLVETSQVGAAREQFQESLIALTDEEKKEGEQRELDDQRKQEMIKHEGLGVPHIDTFLADVLAEDQEKERLDLLPFWPDVTEELRSDYKKKVQPFIKEKEPLVEKKQEEHHRFHKLLTNRRQDNVHKCVKLVRDFEKRLKSITGALDRDDKDEVTIEHKDAVDEIDTLRQKNHTLAMELCELQLRHKEIEETMIEEYESRLGELIKEITDANNNFFMGLRQDLADFNSQVVEEAMKEIDSVQNKIDAAKARDAEAEVDFGDLTDAQVGLLKERDIVMGTISASNDYMLGQVDATLDEIQSLEKSRFQAVLSDARDESSRRDRERTTEIVRVEEENERRLLHLEGIVHDTF